METLVLSRRYLLRVGRVPRTAGEYLGQPPSTDAASRSPTWVRASWLSHKTDGLQLWPPRVKEDTPSLPAALPQLRLNGSLHISWSTSNTARNRSFLAPKEGPGCTGAHTTSSAISEYQEK